MNSPPAPATLALAAMVSGCAWMYGGGVQSAHNADGDHAVMVMARGATGFGGSRQALTMAGDLALGYSPSADGVWFQGSPRIQYAWLPRSASLGARVGFGGLFSGRFGEATAAPALYGELLYALDSNVPRTARPDEPTSIYRGTILGLGAHVGYDVEGAQTGPVFSFSLTITREGISCVGMLQHCTPRPTPGSVPVSAPLEVERTPAR